MSLKAQIQSDLTSSMKARDAVTTSTLRMLRAAIGNAEVAGAESKELTDDQTLDVLRSEAKKRAESATAYEEAGRLESAAKERTEREIIERYLPAAMGDEKLDEIVTDEVARAVAAGIDGPKAMGQVIKAVRDRAGASAEGGRIAAVVKARLGM